VLAIYRVRIWHVQAQTGKIYSSGEQNGNTIKVTRTEGWITRTDPGAPAGPDSGLPHAHLDLTLPLPARQSAMAFLASASIFLCSLGR